jgi:hypothetical protein
MSYIILQNTPLQSLALNGRNSRAVSSRTAGEETRAQRRRSPPAAMETLASAMRREHRRSKQPSASSSASAAAGRVPLVMTFLSCLAWLYVAGRYIPSLRSQPPAACVPSPSPFPGIHRSALIPLLVPWQVVAGRADLGDPIRPPGEELRQRADPSSPSLSLLPCISAGRLLSN